jgi:hypothetical protein
MNVTLTNTKIIRTAREAKHQRDATGSNIDSFVLSVSKTCQSCR